VISRKQVQTYLAVLGVGMLLGLISGWIIRPALEPAISGNRYLPFAQYEFTEDQQLEMKLSLEDTSLSIASIERTDWCSGGGIACTNFMPGLMKT
jgi:hypothetical protein